MSKSKARKMREYQAWFRYRERYGGFWAEIYGDTHAGWSPKHRKLPAAIKTKVRALGTRL